MITRAYDANNSLQLTWQKIAYSGIEIGETDQILTVGVECQPIYAANGYPDGGWQVQRGRNLPILLR